MPSSEKHLVTDFNKSSIIWKTKNGSAGRFNAIACLQDHQKGDSTLLGAVVLAGHVYGTGQLPKSPAYNFIIATDGSKASVFRHDCFDMNHERDFHKRLASLKLSIFDKLADEVSIEDLVSPKYDLRRSISCRLYMEGQDLSFPVQHINVDSKKSKFQVETGPVLFSYNGKLTPAFLFFNKLESCQIVVGYPFFSGKHVVCDMKARFFLDD